MITSLNVVWGWQIYKKTLGIEEPKSLRHFNLRREIRGYREVRSSRIAPALYKSKNDASTIEVESAIRILILNLFYPDTRKTRGPPQEPRVTYWNEASIVRRQHRIF
jgi:hypothetical protein